MPTNPFFRFCYPSFVGSIGARAYDFFGNSNLFNKSMTKSIDVTFKNFITYFVIFKANNRMIFIKSSSKYIFDKFLFS